MFDTNVDSLLDDSVSHAFVDLNTNSSGGHIPNNTSFSMIISMRHTLVDCSVGLDVNIIALLEEGQISGWFGGAMFAETPRKDVPGSSSITE